MSEQDQSFKIDVKPLPDEGKFEPAYSQDKVKTIEAEVEGWRVASPETFQGEEYGQWNTWVEQVMAEGLRAQGVDEHDTALPRDARNGVRGMWRDWALIQTQEGYPLHGLPQNFALAFALNERIGRDMLREGFDQVARSVHAQDSKLVSWLIENPRRFKPSTQSQTPPPVKPLLGNITPGK